jgi:low affinity Fe/Cu permease
MGSLRRTAIKNQGDPWKKLFFRFADTVSRWTGRPVAFALCVVAVVAPACNHLYLRPPSPLHLMLLQMDTSLLGELFRTAA